MKQRLYHVLTIFLFSILILALNREVCASFQDRAETVNHIGTGDVNITLTEYTRRNEREDAYHLSGCVYPGDVISKIPRISNQAASCWIRAEIRFRSLSGEPEGLSMENIQGMPEKWKKCGGYYYYTEPLRQKESVDLFQSVRIPEQWDNSHSGQELGIDIKAEAIQEANFTPDFSKEDPWGDQVIRHCVHETDSFRISESKSTSFTVLFSGNEHRLLIPEKDFFQNIPALMPGDRYSDRVAVRNETQSGAEIFFQTSFENQTREQQQLLEALILQIRYRDRILYEGNMKAESVKNGCSLGSFAPGEGGNLDFTISMPEGLDNDFALRDGDVKWIFTVQEKAEPTTVPANPGRYDIPAETGGGSSPSQSVRTGDDTALLPWIFSLVSAGIVLAAWICYRKRRKSR